MWPNKPKKNPATSQNPVPANDGSINIRWMIQSDYDFVIDIERQSFGTPWTRAELTKFLKHHQHVGYVAVVDGRVAGYFLYVLHPTHFELVSVAVHPQDRRRGVGRKMVDSLTRRMMARRNKTEALVRETNTDAQVFFSKIGFMCRAFVKGAYEGTDEGGVLFVKRKNEKPVDERWLPRNRVGKFYEGEVT